MRKYQILSLMIIVLIPAVKMTAEDALDSALTESQQSEEEGGEKQEEEEEQNQESSRRLAERRIQTLDDHCEGSVCQRFDFGPDEVAFFDLKPAIRIRADTTYDMTAAVPSDSLVFQNSRFVHFPLNLFYATGVVELDMRNCSMEHIRWDNFLMAERLKILLLSDNRIDEIEEMTFSLVPGLAFLFLDSNRLQRLADDSFRGLTNLLHLDLHDNLLEALPPKVFSHLPALQQLNLAGNRLHQITNELFAENGQLISIDLQRNRLQELGEYAFKSQQSLRTLDISHNTDLELLVVSNLRVEHLWARNCSLSRVNIYGVAEQVDLQNNHIMELYFSQPEMLQSLRLRDNELQQIASLTRAVRLQTFDVADNPQLRNLPDLWKVDSLQQLDLSNTSLEVLPISALAAPTHLRSLNVSFNRLQEIDPAHFKYLENLQQFHIHGNDWNCYNLRMIMDMLMQPFAISYTHDEYDAQFPGEYIGGIKCMYRMPEAPEEAAASMEHLKYNNNNHPDELEQSSRLAVNAEESEIRRIRNEMKVIVQLYEQKFSRVFEMINDLEQRLRAFEHINQTMWQHVTITV